MTPPLPDSPPPASADPADDASHEEFMRSVLIIGGVMGSAITLALLAVLDARRASSFALGGVLSWLNFTLLEQGVSHALMRPEEDGTTAVVWRFGLRFVLYGLCLYAMIAAHFLDLLTATLGLSLFVFAIMTKGLLDAVRDLFPGRSGT